MLAGPTNRAWENVVGRSCQWAVGTLCWRVPPMTHGNFLLADPANDPWESCPKKEMQKKEISTMESRNHKNAKM